MRTGAITVAAAAALTAAAIFASAAPAAYLTGSVTGSGSIKLQTNPKTRHVRIEVRYMRLLCSDGVETGGISPEPIKTRYSKRGRFSGTVSSPGSFFYLKGRVRGDRARGTVFWWTDGAPTRPDVMCTSHSDDDTDDNIGAVPWSASPPER